MIKQHYSLGCWSGGGVRAITLIQSAIAAKNKGISFNAVGGNSSGLLTAIASSFGILEKVRDFLLSSNAFDWIIASPISKTGGVSWTAIKNLLLLRDYLGVQDELMLIELFIDEDKWNDWRKSDAPDVYTSVICVETEQEVLINLKDCTWNEARRWISASCRVYVMTQSVKIGNLHYCDGGIASHCPSVMIMEALKEKGIEVSDLYSFYTEHKFMPNKKPSWIMSAIMKLISVMQNSNTRDDAKLEKYYCLANQIKRTHIRFRDAFLHPYDASIERSRMSYDMAISQCKLQLQI